jgi:endonuclease G, mitochondrial
MTNQKLLGYQSSFLGERVPLPKVTYELNEELANLKNSNETELKYVHFSCIIHKRRMLPLFTAVNIKGEEFSPLKRGDDKWFYDDRMDDLFQLGEELYSNDENTFDRGHMVRRMDPAWGKDIDAKKADTDTFHFTNCTPQHANLNRKIWQELERHVLENGASNGKVDISVFTGPVLRKNDKVFKNLIKGKEVQIPVVFWKIIVWKKDTDKKLYAVGFMQSQWPWVKNKLREPRVGTLAAKRIIYTDDYFEHLEFKGGKTYQVAIPTIESQTGLKFNWIEVIFPYKEKTLNEVKGVRVALISKESIRMSIENGTHGAIGQYRLKNIILG